MESKKRVIILVAICLFVLVIGFIFDKVVLEKKNKNYFVELQYSEVIKKLDNKESFVLLLSQTECSHCIAFKPKLKRVATNNKVTIYYLEIDLLTEEEDESLKKYFSVDGTPTTIFIFDGEEKMAYNRINGEVSEEKIIAKLKSNGYID